MTEAKHTEGPWDVDPNNELLITADCDGIPVAEIHDEGEEGDRPVSMAKYNALLIAAAPELLEAAQDALALLVNGAEGGENNPEEIVRSLRASIAKATGA